MLPLMSESAPDLSVLIPTLGRWRRLESTLRSLSVQDESGFRFEVIVVDNGSSDGTFENLTEMAEDFPVPLIPLREPRPGPASARNTGAKAATGRILLFLGDDTEPASNKLLESHVLLHEGKPENRMILGQIQWTPRRPITPFMRWLDTEGPQFHFRDLSAGPVRPSQYLYTSHLSMRRSLFERSGGFDGRMRDAYEDVEFGSRLEREGAELVYHPELIVFHDHPTTLDDSLRRMVRVGRSAALYNTLNPEYPHPAIRAPDGWRWKLLDMVAPLLKVVPGSKALWARHMASYARGYRSDGLVPNEVPKQGGPES